MNTSNVNIEALSEKELSAFIISTLKQIVYKYDPQATIILYGSRARGDYHEESDWDFLVLTSIEASEQLNDNIREDVLDAIELKTFDVVSTLVRNKKVWEEDHAVTNLYESIKEDGILV